MTGYQNHHWDSAPMYESDCTNYISNIIKVGNARMDNEGSYRWFWFGTIQQRFEMENGAGLNITVNKWLTPSGQWLDGSGLKPDVEVVDNFDPETGRDDVYLQGVN